MEGTDIIELKSRLKLYRMRAAYDEVMATGIKRRHEPPQIVGDLLRPRSPRRMAVTSHAVSTVRARNK
jgi:hypothetical protein